jgi:hypothetical protein
MVHGLLAEVEDHNCWTMAEAAGHPGPYRMQHLLSRARVDEQQMLDAAAGWAAGHLSAGQDEDAGDVVLIVDETADEKSSADCAGAACQYSGTVGGIVMCQVAVTLTYAAPGGHAVIGRALYLPGGWAADEERRELAGVPPFASSSHASELRVPSSQSPRVSLGVKILAHLCQTCQWVKGTVAARLVPGGAVCGSFSALRGRRSPASRAAATLLGRR